MLYTKGAFLLISYNTILHQTNAEFTEQRSRFIGHIKPVKSESEAIEFINNIKSKYWDAKHNVYAYSLLEPHIVRYSDDGEPQGTAGLPILEILNKLNLTNVVIVVTRYFGGILLGTGGLVRAYSQSAKTVITSAKIITMHMCKNLKISCDYNLYGKLSSLILSLGGIIDNTVFSDIVEIEFHVKIETFELLKHSINDITCGNSNFTIGNDSFNII